MNKYEIFAKENQYRYFNLKVDKPISDVEPINRCITNSLLLIFYQMVVCTCMFIYFIIKELASEIAKENCAPYYLQSTDCKLII